MRCVSMFLQKVSRKEDVQSAQLSHRPYFDSIAHQMNLGLGKKRLLDTFRERLGFWSNIKRCDGQAVVLEAGRS